MSEGTTPAVGQVLGMSPGRWLVRRALLGLTIMLVGVASAACLFYFTIDAEADARVEAADQVQRKPGSFLYQLQRQPR